MTTLMHRVVTLPPHQHSCTNSWLSISIYSPRNKVTSLLLRVVIFPPHQVSCTNTFFAVIEMYIRYVFTINCLSISVESPTQKK